MFDAGLAQTGLIEPDALDLLAREPVGEPAEGLRFPIDHGDRVALLLERRGQARPDSPASDDNDVHHTPPRSGPGAQRRILSLSPVPLQIEEPARFTSGKRPVGIHIQQLRRLDCRSRIRETSEDHMYSALKRLVVGPPLASSDEHHTRLGRPTALTVFASDAISSTAYATEEILLVLVPVAGLAALERSGADLDRRCRAAADRHHQLPPDDPRLPERRWLVRREPREPRRQPVARRRRVVVGRLRAHRRRVDLGRYRRHDIRVHRRCGRIASSCASSRCSR